MEYSVADRSDGMVNVVPGEGERGGVSGVLSQWARTESRQLFRVAGAGRDDVVDVQVDVNGGRRESFKEGSKVQLI